MIKCDLCETEYSCKEQKELEIEGQFEWVLEEYYCCPFCWNAHNLYEIIEERRKENVS